MPNLIGNMASGVSLGGTDERTQGGDMYVRVGTILMILLIIVLLAWLL
jgi:hypothetical protein